MAVTAGTVVDTNKSLITTLKCFFHLDLLKAIKMFCVRKYTVKFTANHTFIFLKTVQRNINLHITK